MWGRTDGRRIRFAEAALIAAAGLAAGVAWGQDEEGDDLTGERVGENQRYADKQHDYKLIEPRKWYPIRLVDSSLEADVGRIWMQDNLTLMAKIRDLEARVKKLEK